MLGNESNKLCIDLAVDWRGPKTRDPDTETSGSSALTDERGLARTVMTNDSLTGGSVLRPAVMRVLPNV